MVNIQDIADEANVSIATVSYILNGKGNISADTREKVLKIAENLGYQVKKRNHTHSEEAIGIMVGTVTGYFSRKVLESFENHVYQSGLMPVIFSAVNGPDKISFNNRKKNSLLGCLVITYSVSDEWIIQNANPYFPIVTLDRVLDYNNVYSITCDNYTGAFNAVKNLIDLGHRKIAFMGTGAKSYEFDSRYAGYKDALAEADIDVKTQIFSQTDHKIEGGYNAAKCLILQKNLPDAIFCCNDEMAIGVMEACREYGIRIPEDLSICGFDDVAPAGYGLNTVRQPIDDLCNIAVHTIIQSNKRNIDEKNYLLSTELVIRQSAKKKI